MKKELQLKKEHHYVWANYLRNWSFDGEKLWFSTSKGKLIPETTRLVAKERYFYKLTPLTNDHLLLIKTTFANSEMINGHIEFVNRLIYIQQCEQYLKQNNLMDELSRQEFEAHKHNAMENIHTGIENGVSDILPSLVKLDLSCLEDKYNEMALYSYLGQQFARTKSFKDLSQLAISKVDIKQVKQFQKQSEECWWLFSYLIG